MHAAVMPGQVERSTYWGMPHPPCPCLDKILLLPPYVGAVRSVTPLDECSVLMHQNWM
jgi:hypothetical protein